MADKMEAGREMDAQVAERVMGWKEHPITNYPGQTMTPPDCPTDLAMDDPALVILNAPPYSTDKAAAWEVAEKLRMPTKHRNKGLIVKINVDAPENSELVSCSLHKPDLYETMVVEWIDDTMPLAVCGAALKLEGLDA